MKLLMLRPIGAERWQMTCHPPLCLGTSPNPEVQKLLKGDENGPKIHPASHSFLSAASMTLGC